MCLTIPGKIVAVHGEHATVDYSRHGVRENVNTTMVPVEIGDYVLVQGGFVIKVLRADEAREALKTWEAIQEQLVDFDGGLF